MTASSAPNTALKSGAPIEWTQFPTQSAHHGGRERTGSFWALAPQKNAIWVRPNPAAPGEPTCIKVYRSVRSGGAFVQAVAYDDDLTAATP